MNYSSPGGWKDRLRKTQNKQAQRDDMAEVRAQRAALYAQQEVEAQRQAALIAEAQKATRCSCPICGAGSVSIELAERVLRAMERLPSDSKADPAVIEFLAAVSRGQMPPGTARAPRMLVDLKHARPIEQAADPVNPRSRKLINRLDVDSGLPLDGALIELDD